MKSLFNQQHANEFIERINKLTPTSPAQWGTMNVAQMMAHCVGPLKMAHGQVPVKRGIISFLFGKTVKKKIIKEGIQFDKNLPTDPNFKFPSASDFEAEKQKLVNQIHIFSQKGPTAITNRLHSFFGSMTVEEWDIIQTKHLDHHLRQFGA